MELETQTCHKCGETKPLDAFWKSPKGKNGRDRCCATCSSSYRQFRIAQEKSGLRKIGTGRPRRPVPEGTRWCGSCRQPLPLPAFSGSERTCRKCKHHRHLRRKYGLSVADYERLCSEQGDLCAICKEREHRYVDHCHQTGVVRGLLCPTCNTAVGYFETHPGVFDRMKGYLAAIARRE